MLAAGAPHPSRQNSGQIKVFASFFKKKFFLSLFLFLKKRTKKLSLFLRLLGGLH